MSLDPILDLKSELAIMQTALLSHKQAYDSFLKLAEAGDWEDASLASIHTTAHLEAAMDAYTRACRIRIKLGEE